MKQLSTIRPDMPALFMSGYMDDTLGDRGVLSTNANFIQKPFSPRAIAKKVRDILDGFER